MRNLGHGHITISSIPPHSHVVAAFLLWDVLDGSTPSMHDPFGMLNGRTVAGTLAGSGDDPCWSGVSANYAYRANVRRLVHGNGTYRLTGFSSGNTNGQDPWTGGGSTPPDLEGASLVVVYANSFSPKVFIDLSDGATEGGGPLSAAFTGFVANHVVAAKTTFIVADGQSAPDGPATFNGNNLSPGNFQGLDPQDVPSYSLGNLWDTSTYNVSSFVHPGDTSATATINGTSDCLVWVGQALSVRVPSLVLGLGDSISAGDGLGPATGFPNNPNAYPNVLAGHMRSDAANFSISGACASECRPSVLRDELPAAERQHLDPELVTMTAGANDIHLPACILAILRFARVNPCQGRLFAHNLLELRANLFRVLGRVSHDYPHVPVAVTEYYNPFPLPATGSRLCPAMPALLSLSYLVRHQFSQLALLISRHLLLPHAAAYQTAVFDQVQAVLDALNATISQVASHFRHVVIVPLDFTGHDFCHEYGRFGHGWVFAPQLHVAFAFTSGVHSGAVHFDLRPAHNCFSNVPDCRHVFVGSGHGIQLTPLAIKYAFAFAARVNSFPHPTRDGQDEIAHMIQMDLHL
ncbi:MAG TPA: GDSL-type esterase/lipase family protein [Streptosporangiaceae bacterium]|nr:GDSL-type esterase/lipase family protein [Streptosporangiaceae bacterium]